MIPPSNNQDDLPDPEVVKSNVIEEYTFQLNQHQQSLVGTSLLKKVYHSNSEILDIIAQSETVIHEIMNLKKTLLALELKLVDLGPALLAAAEKAKASSSPIKSSTTGDDPCALSS